MSKNKKLTFNTLRSMLIDGYAVEREFIAIVSKIFMKNNFDDLSEKEIKIKFCNMKVKNEKITGFAFFEDKSIYEVEFRNNDSLKGLNIIKIYQ
jgi:hypothetical protein